MNRALMNRTQISVTMKLETDTRALEWLLLFLALVWWQSRRVVNRARHEWVMFWQDVSEAAGFTLKVFTIAFNSWAWALGVRL